jgi:hypothetical protein
MVDAAGLLGRPVAASQWERQRGSWYDGGVDQNPYKSPHISDQPAKQTWPPRFRLQTVLIVTVSVFFPLVYWPMWIPVGHVGNKTIYEPDLTWPILVYTAELSVWGLWKLVQRFI